jgi:hypothetical protein
VRLDVLQVDDFVTFHKIYLIWVCWLKDKVGPSTVRPFIDPIASNKYPIIGDLSSVSLFP